MAGRQWTEGLREKGRLEAFSDGVIAIAITLLVLEIAVPHLEATADGRELWGALADLWPSYVGYALSFVIIGIMWANHHDIFALIDRVDRKLVTINLLLLLGIAFLPFPTALLAEYLGHAGERPATIVYGGWMLLVALCFNALWRHAVRGGRLLAPEVDPHMVATVTQRFNYGPPAYLAALVAALVWPPLSLAIQALLAGIYLLPTLVGAAEADLPGPDPAS